MLLFATTLALPYLDSINAPTFGENLDKRVEQKPQSPPGSPNPLPEDTQWRRLRLPAQIDMTFSRGERGDTKIRVVVSAKLINPVLPEAPPDAEGAYEDALDMFATFQSTIKEEFPIWVRAAPGFTGMIERGQSTLLGVQLIVFSDPTFSPDSLCLEIVSLR